MASKDPNAVALGRKGGLARAAALTAKRRREIAMQGVAARLARKKAKEARKKPKQRKGK